MGDKLENDLSQKGYGGLTCVQKKILPSQREQLNAWHIKILNHQHP